MSCSLKYKLMGLFLFSCLLLISISTVLSLRQTSAIRVDRNTAVHQADTIAMNGAIEKHRHSLDKTAVNLLNTDELITFLGDTSDSDAKMIPDGLFLSFQEEGIARFVLYSTEGGLLLEQTGGQGSRSAKLAAELHTIYDSAARDFSFHYYFSKVSSEKYLLP